MPLLSVCALPVCRPVEQGQAYCFVDPLFVEETVLELYLVLVGTHREDRL